MPLIMINDDTPITIYATVPPLQTNDVKSAITFTQLLQW